MHDVGTGDGILQATREHYGKKVFADDVGLSFETGLREQPEQNTYRTVMGSPVASAVDA